MRLNPLFLALLVGAPVLACFAQDAAPPSLLESQFDRQGRLTALAGAEDWADVTTEIRIATPEWAESRDQRSSEAQTRMAEAGVRETAGAFDLGEGRTVSWTQHTRESGDALVVNIDATAQADLELEGLFWFVAVPVDNFVGGRGVVLNTGQTRWVDLPQKGPKEEAHLLHAIGTGAEFRNASGDTAVSIRIDEPLEFVVQDNRRWGDDTYSIFVPIHEGALRNGQTVSRSFELRLRREPNPTPVQVRIDPGRSLYRLDGFGGNFCWGLHDPITQYNLENLRVAWARTELRLDDWKPNSPEDSGPEQDKLGSELRDSFLIAQELAQKRIPLAVATWRPPVWAMEDPSKSNRGHRLRIPPEKWPAVEDAIVEYVAYMKSQYNAEPDLFSFNESDGGVNVHLTPEEHRDLIKRLGAKFEAAGLKTRMLLADTTNPRDKHTYALPTAQDPEAMKYVGAISFHSWGGATPEQYRAWADLAKQIDRPLIVGELGYDAQAWRQRGLMETYRYAMQELKLIQQILRHARPQALLQWELTGDYGFGDIERDANGREIPQLQSRFWIFKHFANLTPPNAEAIAIDCGDPSILCTAFRGDDGTLVLHLANLGLSRKVQLAGLPESVKQLKPIRTSRSEQYQSLEPIDHAEGGWELELPSQSLTTLVWAASAEHDRK